MSDDRPVCPWELDADGHIPLVEVLQANDNCRFPAGFRGWTTTLGVYDNLGHQVEGDYDPHGRHGCRHRETPEWRAAHRPKTTKERPMDEHHEQQAVVVQGEPHGVEATHAEVGVPSFDLSKVLPADGAISPLTATLGGLAILGGVALKVLPAWLKSRAEMATQRLALKAKRMELEQKAKQDEQGGDCASRYAACVAAVGALEERLKLVEQQADGLATELASAKDAATKISLSGNASVDSERVGKLEEQVAKLTAKVGA